METAYNNATSSYITIDDIPKRIRSSQGCNSAPFTKELNRPLKEAVETYEKELIMKELANQDGKITDAAKKLGISKQLLVYKIDKYHLKNS